MRDLAEQIAKTVHLIRAQVGGQFVLSEADATAIIKSLTDLSYVRGVNDGIQQAREKLFPQGVVNR